MARRVIEVAGGRALVETRERGVTWQEWVALPTPDVDAPIRPLAAPPAELALSLDGDPSRNREAERRRKADAILETHGVKPAPWV